MDGSVVEITGHARLKLESDAEQREPQRSAIFCVQEGISGD